MKTIYFLFLIFAGLFLTACPKSTPVKPEVLERAAGYEIRQLEDNLYGYECAYFGGILDITETSTGKNNSTTRTRACAQGTVVDKPKAQRIRDATVYRLIRVIDYNYFQFENELYTNRSTGSFLADAIDVGGNLAGAITNGERAKTIINSALVAFRATRKSASIHYFQEQTADVLITKMQTARDRVLTDIIDQLNNKSVDEYSLDAALSDTIRYFYAGTLPRALQELREDTNIDAKDAKEDLRQVKGIKPSPPATAEDVASARKASRALVSLATSLSTDAAENAKKKIKAMFETLEADQEVKKVLDQKQLSSTRTDFPKMLEQLADLRSDARTFQNFDLLKKIDTIIINSNL